MFSWYLNPSFWLLFYVVQVQAAYSYDYFFPKQVSLLEIKNWQDTYKLLAREEGILSISGFDGDSFQKSVSHLRNGALHQCMLNSSSFHESNNFPDGSTKATIGIKATDKFSLCGDERSNMAAEIVRGIFTQVEKHIISGLATEYSIYEDYLHKEDLDHFSIYRANPSETLRRSLNKDLSVELHVDKGLFVLLAAAEGLVIRRRKDNKLYKVGVTDSTQLFLMLGEGLSILSSDFGAQLKELDNVAGHATEHGVLSISPTAPRVSIARMILPSKKATNFWMNFHSTSSSSPSSNMTRRNLKDCAAGEVYCW